MRQWVTCVIKLSIFSKAGVAFDRKFGKLATIYRENPLDTAN